MKTKPKKELTLANIKPTIEGRWAADFIEEIKEPSISNLIKDKLSRIADIKQNRILTIVDELLNYYRRTMGVGHTHLAMDGLDNSKDGLMVCVNYRQGLNLGLNKEQFITLDDFMNLKTRGIRKPIVLDNFTVQYLLCELLEAVRNRLYEESNENKNSR